MTDSTTTPNRPAARTIVAVVTESGGDRVRDRAVEIARERGAGVILYDADAGSRLLEDPLPNQFSAHGEEEQFGDRLTVNDLEAAGRGPLARQVRAAQEAGVEAWGWLPSDTKADTLREYARQQGADTVLLGDAAKIDGDLDAATGPTVEVVPAA
jgi:nucleotide-binding universal stress UspA family protein